MADVTATAIVDRSIGEQQKTKLATPELDRPLTPPNSTLMIRLNETW
jgi:hypothetical protein